MKILIVLLGFLTIPALVTTTLADEPQIRQFSDPKHPGMVGWKIDYGLPEEAGSPQIELDYDYWDPKVEGDAFSKKRLNAAEIDSKTGTLSLVVLLSAKESFIVLNGKEVRGKGISLLTDKKVKVPAQPTLDSGTGGFILVFKPNAKTPPDQVESYFDLDSWVLLTIRFDHGG
jgi:hypothetical protein